MFINEWLESVPEVSVIKLNVSDEGLDYSKSVKIILEKITNFFCDLIWCCKPMKITPDSR